MIVKKTKFAFSLIELSVVILIVGILILGITKGSRIISESRIKAAKSLTANSPISSISGLVLWLDATDPSTIATGTIASNSYTNSPNDNDLVVYWKDRNPQTTNQKIIAVPGDDNRPTYIKNGIGNLPTLKFDGLNDYLTGNPVIANGATNYTMILVWQKNTLGVQYFLLDQGDASCAGNRAGVGLNASFNRLVYLGCGGTGEYDFQPSSFSTVANVPYATIVRVNKNQPGNKVTFYNNNFTEAGSPTDTTVPLTSTSLVIGAQEGTFSSPFSGYISEVIILDRAINNIEVTSIQDYLSRKYNIK